MIPGKMESFEAVSTCVAETQEWGRRLSELLRSGDVVALVGELGSGKTTLTRGICEGLEVKDAVTSPSFTLVQEYSGRIPVFHFDFYRLEGPEQIEGIDIDHYLLSDGISIIEWADRAEPLLPGDRFTVLLESAGYGPDTENKRLLSFRGPAGRGLDRWTL